MNIRHTLLFFLALIFTMGVCFAQTIKVRKNQPFVRKQSNGVIQKDTVSSIKQFLKNASGIDTLVLNGKYDGTNLFFQNSLMGKSKGFSAVKVLLNGKEMTDEINSNAFEVDLGKGNMKNGDTYEVKIVYRTPGVVRQIANPQNIKND